MSTRFPYSPRKRPPVPAVVLDLSDPAGSMVISSVSAHLDTAADMTVVPLPVLQQLGLTPRTALPSQKGTAGRGHRSVCTACVSSSRTSARSHSRCWATRPSRSC